MFQGFSDKTGDFFWELRFNNSREWFNPRKEQFNELIMGPVKEFSGELYDWFAEKYPDLHLNLHISRIYRDARRLFGRGPLKDHIWFSFQNETEHRDNAPNFWFELGAEGYMVGFGYWMRPADAERYRKLVDFEPAELRRLVRLASGAKIDTADQAQRFSLGGERYARPKGHVGDELEDWYNRKWIGLQCARPYDVHSASRELLQTVEADYEFLIPFYRYFDKVYRMVD